MGNNFRTVKYVCFEGFCYLIKDPSILWILKSVWSFVASFGCNSVCRWYLCQNEWKESKRMGKPVYFDFSRNGCQWKHLGLAFFRNRSIAFVLIFMTQVHNWLEFMKRCTKYTSNKAFYLVLRERKYFTDESVTAFMLNGKTLPIFGWAHRNCCKKHWIVWPESTACSRQHTHFCD